MKKYIVFGLYSLVPFFVSCSTLNKPMKSSDFNLKSKRLEQPVLLRWKGEKGQKVLTKYFSHSKILNYEDQQLIRERDEEVEFKVENTYTEITPEKISFISTSKEKDGVVELNDLAFPEVGQKIEFVVTPTAEVLRAGSYPKESVFFIPAIPLPKDLVEVGDTWTMSKDWIGAKNGIPLKVEVLGIFKEAVECLNGTCALIELSGNVGILHPTPGAIFDSKLEGFLLFSLEKGEVLWSQVESVEVFNMEGVYSRVASCLSSYVIEPKDWALSLPESRKNCTVPAEDK